MTNDPSRRKYSARFLVNLALTVVVTTAAWVWFNIHLKPHVDARVFGGVTIGVIFLFACGVVKSFVGDDAENAVHQAIDLRPTTYTLLAAIPVLFIAYLTTFSVYLVAAKTPDVDHPLKFRVTTGGRTQAVELTKARPEAALTFPLTIHGVKLSIDTDSPRGYAHQVHTVSNRYEEVVIPDSRFLIPRRLLRLVPGRNLIRLSDKEDTTYHLIVYRKEQELLDQPYMKFETLYLGETFDDDVSALNADPTYAADLREYFHGLGVPADRMKALVDRYVSPHRAVGKAVLLQDNDRVRILLTPATGTPFDRTVIVGPQEVQTIFLQGASP